MNLHILLVIAAIILLSQNAVFAGTSSAAHEAIMLAAQDAPQVELYITTWCPYCQKAMKFFESRGILFTVYDIEKDQGAARRKSELDGRRGVPFAIINGKRIHGYSEHAYQRALDGK